ncbi:bifunctional 4-hydroxy-2-oxoglutarate aldolase/2-dehydro-3-deoxy-phosphogluconate aldolase [soil metagenome]
MPQANPDGIRTGRVIAILRDREGRRLREISDTLVDAGIRALELTTNTPGAAEVVAEIAGAGRAHVGMGTVRTPDQVRIAADAGASFVVTPALSLTVGELALELGLDWYPGAVTPTEIETAWAAGATAVKVFPVASLGGPQYLSEVRGPLDDIPLVPTGGVRIDDIRDYLQRGAYAVGMGSPLLGSAFAEGDLAGLRARALEVVSAATREQS